MNEHDEIEIDDEVLDLAAGGVQLMSHPAGSSNYTVNSTIYFQV